MDKKTQMKFNLNNFLLATSIALDFVSNTSSFFSKEFANVGYEVSKSVK